MHIQVEHCVDCHLHNWCSRHNEAKYHEFYDRIEAKARQIFKNCNISKNQPPEHLIKYSNLSTTGLGLQRYFDEQKQEIVVFPRHGSFEIKVNGFLIFSKLQSNLWPNIDKVGSLLQQINQEYQSGGDIKKFSLEYRLVNENEDQYFVDTYKKVIKFKINKRPYSSQYNASSYISRGSNQPSADYKQPIIRRNVVSVKKSNQQSIHHHSKLELDRRPIPKLRQRKTEKVNEPTNEFRDFQEGDNFIQEHYPVADISKVNKSEKFSPRARRILLKKEGHGQLKPLGIQGPAGLHKQIPGKLQKKPSKKLVIKTNDKKSEEGSGKKPEIFKITDKIEESESMVVQEQRVLNRGVDKPKEEIKVEVQIEYQPKEELIIQKKYEQNIIQHDKIQKEPELEPEERVEHIKQESSNGGYEDLLNEMSNQDKQPEEAEKSKTIEQKPKTPEQDREQEEKISEKETPHSLEEKPEYEAAVPTKKKTEKSYQNYEQENYDDYEEEPINEERPETSSHSRRGEIEVPFQQSIEKKEELGESDFKRKTQKNQQINHQEEIENYQEDFPVEEGDELNQIPIIINKKKSQKKLPIEEKKQKQQQYERQIYQEQEQVNRQKQKIDVKKIQSENQNKVEEEKQQFIVETHTPAEEHKVETHKPAEEHKEETKVETHTPAEEHKVETHKPAEEHKEETQVETHKPAEEHKVETHKPAEEHKVETHTPAEEHKEETKVETHTPAEEHKVETHKPAEEHKVQTHTPAEEHKVETHTPAEEHKVETHKPAEEHKVQTHTPAEEHQVETHTPAEEHKVETLKPSEEHKEETKVETHTPAEEHKVETHQPVEEHNVETPAEEHKQEPKVETHTLLQDHQEKAPSQSSKTQFKNLNLNTHIEQQLLSPQVQIHSIQPSQPQKNQQHNFIKQSNPLIENIKQEASHLTISEQVSLQSPQLTQQVLMKVEDKVSIPSQSMISVGGQVRTNLSNVYQSVQQRIDTYINDVQGKNEK